MTLDGPGLIRTVLGLAELELRLDWLKSQLAHAAAEPAARALNQLCEANEASDPAAREVVLALALAIVADDEWPVLDGLRRVAAERGLFSLERLLRRASAASQPPSETGGADSLRVPDYRRGRELTLGERRNFARRASRAWFDRLLADPHPRVIAELLTNPRLVEDDVVRLVARRPARPAILRSVCRSTRWMAQRRVRLALLLNPGTPPELSIPLVAVCTRSELGELLQGVDTPRVLRAVAHEFLERRPPLPAGDGDPPALH